MKILFKYYLIFLCFVILLAGCIYDNISKRGASALQTNTQKSIENNPIPFKYAFTGFVPVQDVYNDLPVGVKVFKTQEEWNEFKNKYLNEEDIPYPGYSGTMDFSKDSLVYYSMIDAKADFYAMACQIDKITVKDDQINIITKDIDGNLKITANNDLKSGGHRYVILVIIDKNELK